MDWLRKLLGRSRVPNTVGLVDETAVSPEPSTLLSPEPNVKTTLGVIKHFEGDLGKALEYSIPNYPEIAEELVALGAPLDVWLPKGRSLLHKCSWPAIHSDATRCLDALLAAGMDINVRNSEGDTPLHDCAEDMNDQIAGVLLGRGADPNARNGRGEAPLHLAAFHSHIECCGPPFDGPSFSLGGEDPRSEIIARIILNGNANVDPEDDHGRTPLMVAAGSLNRRVVETLLSRGANPRLTDREGLSAVDHALSAYDLSITEDRNDPYYVIFDARQLAAERKAVAELIRSKSS